MILNDVIDYLVTQFTAAVDPVRVGDGHVARLIGDEAWVLVGSDGIGGDSEGITLSVTPSLLGPGPWEDEAVEIVCSSWAQSGSGTFTDLRTEAFGNAAACAASVDRHLGGLLLHPSARVSDLRGVQALEAEGGVVVVTFTVSYTHLNT